MIKLKNILSETFDSNFESWFNGSVVTDKEGNPLKMFHGTNAKENFSIFNTELRGAWFTANPKEAGAYAGGGDLNVAKKYGRTIPVFLNIKNPKKFTIDEFDRLIDVWVKHNSYKKNMVELKKSAIAGGFDGIYLAGSQLDRDIYVAFYQGQIKNAITLNELKSMSFDNDKLSSLVTQDQSERNEYKKFVQSKAKGDYELGSSLYADAKNRKKDDIFGDNQRLKQFINMKFDFNNFNDSNWNDYWLLSQHCDFDRNFQKKVLSTLKTYLGTDHSHYKYLYDRIECGSSGKQKHGTQSICTKDGSEGLNELDYPLAGKEDLQSYGGMEGWKGKVVYMTPDKFLRLASPLPDNCINQTSLKKVEDRMKNQLPLDFCVLEVNMKTRTVTGHEGRHRCIAAKKLGIEKVPVLIYTGSNFDRVPQWNQSTHDDIDKAGFKPQLKESLNGNHIVGAISKDGEERIISSDVVKIHLDLYKLHPEFDRKNCESWRYNKELKSLFFWHKFVETKYSSPVKEYLKGNGFEVNKVTSINSLPDAGMKPGYDKQKALYQSHGAVSSFYRDPDGEAIAESVSSTIQMYHGGSRWSYLPDDIQPGKKNRYEAGIGIYFTNSYNTARKYAKGNKVVHLVEIDKQFKDIDNVMSSVEKITDFIKNVPQLSSKKEIINDVTAYATRVGKTEIPLSILNNLVVNYQAARGKSGIYIAKFFTENGADAHIQKQSGDEIWLVVFNPKILKSVKVVNPKEINSDSQFMLPNPVMNEVHDDDEEDRKLAAAERYFSIGQDEDVADNYCWIWDGSFVKAKKGGSHGMNFTHDLADRNFKGWYDVDKHIVSIVFPERERRKIPGEPSIEDVPQNLYVALQRKFSRSLTGGDFRVFENTNRKLIEERDEDYDVSEDFMRRRDEELMYLCRALKNSGGKGRVTWKTVPASLLKRVWLQFGKYNRINSNDLDKIADQIMTNIARLRASTEMMGHSQIGKEDIESETGYEFTEEEWGDWMTSYFTDLNGSWLLSDYGLPKLESIYPTIFNAKTDEEKLYACDKALNVVHQRNDLAAMFVEGGTTTLTQVANQGGYSSDT